MLLLLTPEELRQNDVLNRIIKPILGSSYIDLTIPILRITENIDKENTEINFDLCVTNPNNSIELSCSGKGVIDALLKCLVGHFKNDYPSLNKISIYDFTIQAQFKPKYKLSKLKSDALVEVNLILSLPNRHYLYFTSSSASMNAASIESVLSAIHLLINAEQCAKLLRENIKEANKRNRHDLVDEYTQQLSDIINNIAEI